MDTPEQKDFEKKTLDPLLSGERLFGKDGVSVPMLKSFIEMRRKQR